MQLPCNARLIARLVLAWFALTLGAAVASPLVTPRATQIVCSGASVKVVIQGAGGDVTVIGHTALECPLCAVMNAPPPVAHAAVQPRHALSHVLLPRKTARLAAGIAAPWQARAPPDAA